MTKRGDLNILRYNNVFQKKENKARERINLKTFQRINNSMICLKKTALLPFKSLIKDQKNSMEITQSLMSLF